MTKLYFVRHAQPDYRTGEDSTFSLSAEGMEDRMRAAEALRNIPLDICISSPYKRSIDTIIPCAEEHSLKILTDIRLRERDRITNKSNNYEMFKKRWADFSYHEEGGESLGECQKRNIEAIGDILEKYDGKSILIGTHGTALSTIINRDDASFGLEAFMRIINYMPYVVRMDFEGKEYIGMEELAFVAKKFHGQR